MLTDDYLTPEPSAGRNALRSLRTTAKKKELVEWAKENSGELKKHFLCGTGTTARLIAEETELPVRAYKVARLAATSRSAPKLWRVPLIWSSFFWDPLEAQPHDPDVRVRCFALRWCMTSPLPTTRPRRILCCIPCYMNEEYDHQVINYNKKIQDRMESFLWSKTGLLAFLF